MRQLRFAPLLLCLGLLVTTRAAVAGPLDGTWVQLPVPLAGPSVAAHAAVYDPVRQRMIVFGGSGPQNELLGLNLAGAPRWSGIPAVGPAPSQRYGHTMVYDSRRDRLIVFGGYHDPNGPPLSDVWQLALASPATWSPLTVDGAPPSLLFASAIYDSAADRMLVFGGWDGAAMSQDTWELSFVGTPTWAKLAPAGPLPPPRDLTSAVCDPVGHRMVVFGGNVGAGIGSATVLGDTWALDLSGPPTWTQLATSGVPPSARLGHAAVYDAARNRMIVAGGNPMVIPSQYLPTAQNDVYSLALDSTLTWTQLAPGGANWPGRQQHVLVYDPVGDRAIAAGGLSVIIVTFEYSYTKDYGDSYALSLGDSSAWNLLVRDHAAPGALVGPAGGWDHALDSFYFYGGADGGQSQSDLWQYRLGAAGGWSYLGVSQDCRPAGCTAIPGAAGMGMVCPGGVLNMIGGNSSRYDLNNGIFTYGSGPSPRLDMGFHWDFARSRLVVFGGRNGTTALGDIQGVAQPVGTPPAPRYGHTFVYDDQNDLGLIFGGTDGTTIFGDLWGVDYFHGTWAPLVTQGTPPSPRHHHFAFFDSNRRRMIVVGGFDANGTCNDVYSLDLFASPPAWSQLQPAGTPPTPRGMVGAAYDVTDDILLMFGGSTTDPATGPVTESSELWALTWGDPSTPTRLSFAEESIAPGEARLTWFTPNGAGQAATAYRSMDGSAWSAIATLVSDASGRFVLDDRIAAGGRFDYRLGVRGAGGAEEFTDDHWVVVPGSLAFGIASTGGNPSRGGLRVEFALAQPGAASVDLLDIAGRRLRHADVGALGAGAHTVDVGAQGALAPGVYFVRLVQGAHASVRKVAVVR